MEICGLKWDIVIASIGDKILEDETTGQQERDEAYTALNTLARYFSTLSPPEKITGDGNIRIPFDFVVQQVVHKVIEREAPAE